MGVIHELVETVSPDTVYDAVYYFFATTPSSLDADALFLTIMPNTLTMSTNNIILVTSLPMEDEQIVNGRESSMNP